MSSSYVVVEEPSLPMRTVLVPSLLLTDLLDALESSELEFGLSDDETVRVSTDLVTAMDAWFGEDEEPAESEQDWETGFPGQ